MKSFSVPFILAAASFAGAQQAPTPPSPIDLLKASMDKYASMKSFSVHCVLAPRYKDGKAPAGVPDFSLSKDVKFQTPNLFAVDIKIPTGTARAISDGKNVLLIQGTEGMTDKAPATMADLSASQMLGNPIMVGAGLPMVVGSAGYDSFVDTSKVAPTAGTEETLPDGKKALHVKFQIKGPIRNVDMLIGEDSKLVYSATYSPDGGGDGSAVEEKYSDFQIDPTFASTTFSTAAPAGVKVQSLSEMMAQQDSQEKPPVPIGKPAPDFRVFSLTDGTKVKLSDLKGKVVMIDFWATWCGPCKESLPHTEDIFKKYGTHNVKVLTISDEDADTIRKYIKEQSYTFPAFRDPESIAEKLYSVNAIPTVVIIDAAGNLAAYFVGMREEDVLVAALKKAGAN